MIRLIVATATCLLLLFAVPAEVLAYSPTAGACGAAQSSGTGATASATCNDPNVASNNPITGPNGIILKVANFIALLAGLSAVIVIIVAGFRYVTSGGDPGKAKNARDAILYAIIGLVVILLGDTILNFVLSKLS